MPSLAEPPRQPPTSTAARPPGPRPAPQRDRDPERTAIWIGIGGTILFHVLFFGSAPFWPEAKSTNSDLWLTQNGTSARDFDIEITADQFEMPETPPPPEQFVETNPDAPDNVPDETRNFAAQNQQAAQETPDPDGENDRAATEGQKEIESTALVAGTLSEPQIPPAPAEPPAPESEPTPEPSAAARQEQIPLPGDERFEGDSPDGVGTNIAEVAPRATAVPERVEGVPNAPALSGLTFPQVNIDPNRPAPRPRIDRNVRNAPIFEDKFGTKNIGVPGRDARWSEYGAYLQRLIDAVQMQWERIITESRVYPPSQSYVRVTFRLNSEGMISKIVKVDGTAGHQGEQMCVSAIADPGSFGTGYGKWTEDMTAVLGEEQELTFTFYYN